MQALSVQSLHKIYRNGVNALKGINLDIEEGDYFALLGPNGAGKTTLIGILTSLVKKSSGKVFIFGHDIDTDFARAKSMIGVVPQEFNFNIFEKVNRIIIDQAGYFGIPVKVAKERAEKYLHQLGLWEKRNTVSRFLSGGMKRRLMIARALIQEPKMLILDEPTAGVDVELRHSMWEFLTEINQQGVTIILTTHYLEEAESQCRQIAIIDQGEIIENTSMAALLQQLEYEHLILYLKESIAKAPKISGVKFQIIDPMTLEVEVPKNITLSALFSELERHGIIVNSMRNKTSRLESLFLNLTKRDVEEE